MTEPPWQRYTIEPTLEMRPYVPGEDITGISTDYIVGAPKKGDMVARHPEADDRGMWFISGQQFTGYTPANAAGSGEPEPAFWPPGLKRPSSPGRPPLGKKRTDP